MAVLYDGKKIIPAPLINISKQYERNDSGKRTGAKFTLTLTGTIVPTMGSPASTPGVAPDWSDNFWIAADYPPCEEIAMDGRLASILRKQEALRCLFAEDGHVFEIEPLDGSAPLSCNPTVVDIQFTEGLWVEKCDYTITLEAPIIYGNAMCTSLGEDEFDGYITGSSEDWTIEFNDTPQDATVHHTFRISHNLSATGKLIYDTDGTIGSQPWEHAKTWIESRLSYTNADIIAKLSGGTIGASGFTPYNHIRAETIGIESGTYSVNENWILTNGSSALEDFTISTKTSTQDPMTVVNIEGQIIGLEVIAYPYSVTSSKYTNASSKWTTVASQLFTRAQTYSGITLNTTAVATQVGKNPVTGVINYSYEYNNRPSNCITGALLEVITITDVGAGDVFAVIPVIGRAAGPVLQDICTVTETRRSINIEVIMPFVDGCVYETWLTGKPDVTAIVEAVKPVADQVFSSAPTETWVPNSGKYSYSQEWVYQ